jgi:hypothetical protein
MEDRKERGGRGVSERGERLSWLEEVLARRPATEAVFSLCLSLSLRIGEYTCVVGVSRIARGMY